MQSGVGKCENSLSHHTSIVLIFESPAENPRSFPRRPSERGSFRRRHFCWILEPRGSYFMKEARLRFKWAPLFVSAAVGKEKKPRWTNIQFGFERAPSWGALFTYMKRWVSSAFIGVYPAPVCMRYFFCICWTMMEMGFGFLNLNDLFVFTFWVVKNVEINGGRMMSVFDFRYRFIAKVIFWRFL